MENLDDQILVQRALTGDIESFAELCRRYYSSLQGIAYSVLQDPHLAEDAAQEALAETCRRLPTLRKPRVFSFWAGSICRNIARDMLRARVRERNLIRDCPPVSVGNPDLHESGLKAAIRKLPDSDREVIYLRYTHELSYQQIASVLGISEQAVNGRLRRAKQKLACFLRLEEKTE
jgi:RNA polymerase sigma-70 factor (ECF subfamily)